MINQLDLIDMYRTLQQQNMHFFQVHMEQSPRYTTPCVIKQILTNLKELKPDEVYSLSKVGINRKWEERNHRLRLGTNRIGFLMLHNNITTDLMA